MLKEHAIEQLGEEPVWTIGQGGSGGSVQQQLIAQNYPGILDGLMPGASFPDGAGPDYPDCRLLNAYFETADGADPRRSRPDGDDRARRPERLPRARRRRRRRQRVRGLQRAVVPPAEIFDPATNPDGIRCTVWDSMVNIYGTDPATGYARRTLDNVGVQYGLAALNDGAITSGEFLDLNEGIGGYDENGQIRRAALGRRSGALAIAFSSGRVNQAAGGIRDVPVLDVRNYQDDEVNVHQYVNTYRMRARLDAEYGGHANHVMWRAQGGSSVSAMNAPRCDPRRLDGRDRRRRLGPHGGREGGREQAGGRGRRLLDRAARHQRRRADRRRQHLREHLPAARPPRRRRRQAARLDGAQVPARADRLRRLRGPVHAGRAGAPRGDLPERGLRLVAARRRGAGARPAPGRSSARQRAEAAKRTRDLGLSVQRAGNRKLTLQARLRPCPATIWQQVSFEKKKANGDWKSFDSVPVSGKKCRASTQLKLGKGRKGRKVRVRAVADAVYGYSAARSKTRRG